MTPNQGLRIGITTYKLLRARVLIPIPQRALSALSQPYRDVDLNLPQPKRDIIRTSRRSYPHLTPALSAPYPNTQPYSQSEAEREQRPGNLL